MVPTSLLFYNDSFNTLFRNLNILRFLINVTIDYYIIKLRGWQQLFPKEEKKYI